MVPKSGHGHSLFWIFPCYCTNIQYLSIHFHKQHSVPESAWVYYSGGRWACSVEAKDNWGEVIGWIIATRWFTMWLCGAAVLWNWLCRNDTTESDDFSLEPFHCLSTSLYSTWALTRDVPVLISLQVWETRVHLQALSGWRQRLENRGMSFNLNVLDGPSN